MIPHIHKILFCTQMGPSSGLILRHACALAQCHQAKITVLHVHAVLSESQEGMVESYAGKGTLHQAVEAEEHHEEDVLHRMIEDFFTAEIGPEAWKEMVDDIVVAEGRARDRILEHIEAVGADIVVMGGHRHGLIEMLLGSTTQQVIAKSKVPVLVVPVPS